MKKTLALLLVPMALAIGCGRSQKPGIRFGAILTTSGPAAPYGTDNLKGLQLAQALINDAGGVGGQRIELDIQDDAGDPTQAVSLAKRLAADNSVLAILGPTRTGSSVAVSRIVSTLKIPMVSVGSTGDWAGASGQEFNEWTFRSTRVDTQLVRPLLRAMRDRFGVHTLAAIYTANDDWSASVMKVYEQAVQELGLELVAKESQMTGDADRSAQLTKILETHPDALIINAIATDAPTIASQARRVGITARFLGTAGFTNPDTWRLADSGALEGTVLADNFYPESPRPAVQRFVAEYRRRFSAPSPAYAAYAFDGLNLLARAFSDAANPKTRETIRFAFGRITAFEGVLGVLSYHGRGDADKTPILLQISGSQYTRLGQ